MKRLFCVILALGIFGLGSLSAQTAALEADETQALFGSQESAQITALSEEEMQETQGEFWDVLGLSLIIAAVTGIANCLTGNCGEFETAGVWNF